MKTSAVILAAGQGTRMRSRLPKVLHPLMGYPMVWYALRAAQEATGSRPTLVIGYAADQVRATIGEAASYVIQEHQLGTGHALRQAEEALRGKADFVLVTTADMPLLTAQTLEKIVKAQQNHAGPLTLLTVLSEDSFGFGRVIRDATGGVQEVIEEAHATPEQLAIRELNTSVYCFSADWLWPALRRIPLSPKGEYYLTDLVGIAVKEGLSVQAVISPDAQETIGVNTRVHLAQAGLVLRQRINTAWMLEGVTIIDPATTYIEPGVKLDFDTTIWPNTYLHGETTAGEGCQLGPNSIIRDSTLGERCKVVGSYMEGARLEDEVEIGPFARLRKGAHLGRGVHMGNFGEIKNSYLGPDTKMGHFSYIGDATIGPGVNIGAGTITCNLGMDGKKSPTEIGAGAFIGSDTMLVAPVKIGEGSATGSGAVVTKNIPPNSLAVGMPARVIRKLKKDD